MNFECLKGLQERLSRELTEMRPFQSTHHVVMARTSELDAWNGARDFAHLTNIDNFLTTKAEYDEHGGEYFKEHNGSNQYIKTPSKAKSTGDFKQN